MTRGPDRRRAMALAGAALAAPAAARAATPADRAQVVDRLYREAVVIDGNLVAGLLNGDGDVTPQQAARVRAAGLTAFKQTLGGSGEGRAETLSDLAHFDRAVARNAGLFRKVEAVGDIAAAKRSGRVGVIYSFESADMHEGRLDSIDDFRRRGVRVMGLSYNLRSPFGTGTLVKDGRGLTPLGREAVARMNALGVSVDLSHSDEPTGLQALAASRRPVLVTHAGCAAVHPHPRNKSDRLLRAVADGGGVVGIYDLSYLGDYPRNPSLDTYMRHLVHALRTCGEDHVGVGSDTSLLKFDTSPAGLEAWNRGEAQRRAAGIAAPEEGPLPFVTGLETETRWRVIAGELVRRGYGPRVVDKVLGANFQRGFAETW